jgi:hypothetical protein
MARSSSAGKCALCGEMVAKSAMTRHLTACRLRTDKPQSTSSRRGRPTPLYHLVVTDRYSPLHWLHLEAWADASLEDLDAFLRVTWLECCGHLSAFRFGRRSFVTAGKWGWVGDENEDMDARLGEVLAVGGTFDYEYDFGSTTRLRFKVVGLRDGWAASCGIKLLAGNLPPEIPCERCGKPATLVCAECFYGGSGWLCKACRRRHPCGEDVLLPVVSSPRVGVCGYDGPGLKT